MLLPLEVMEQLTRIESLLMQLTAQNQAVEPTRGTVAEVPTP